MKCLTKIRHRVPLIGLIVLALTGSVLSKTYPKSFDPKRHLPLEKVKAGMTGWAQIHGFRGDSSLRKRTQYDLYYVRNWSIWLDFLIILRTPFHILKRKNAY